MTCDPAQLDRIQTMEQSMHEAAAAVEALRAALEQYESVLPRLRALETYYHSPLWMADFDDDCADRLPKTLPRGVLTEDALYDLLCDNDQLIRALSQLTLGADCADASGAEGRV